MRETEMQNGPVAKIERQRPARSLQCRGYLKRRLTAKLPEIVAGFIKGAESGSYAHVKLATELLEKQGQEGRTQKGSATRLLEELQRKGY